MMRNRPESYSDSAVCDRCDAQGGKTAVKILVARQAVSGKLEAVCNLIAAMRSEAQRQPGYIVGETLAPLPHSSEILVVSTWHCLEDWNRWFEHPVRLRLQAEMNAFLVGRTEYTIYRDL